MNNIDFLKEYVDILDKDATELTQSDYNTLFAVRNNVELRDVVSEIDRAYTKDDRLKTIENYKTKIELANKSELDKIKEACQKAFGITLDNIEFKKLKSGIDIIAFYDNRINRKRLIDYSYAKSLVNEFSNIQNNNIEFQSDDYEKNANDIAQDEATKNSKRELNMIDIERVRSNYNELINRVPNLDNNKIYAINKLLSEAESRNIKYINFENLIGLDEKGNIIEASLNRENEVQIGSAEDIKRNVNTVDNAGNTEYYENNSNLNEDTLVTPTEFENEEEMEFPDDAMTDTYDFRRTIELEMEKHKINKNVDEVLKKVEKYALDPNLLEKEYEQKLFDDNYYEFYSTLVDEYIKNESYRKSKAKIQTKSLVLSRETGSILAIVASIISIVVSIITILMIIK